MESNLGRLFDEMLALISLLDDLTACCIQLTAKDTAPAPNPAKCTSHAIGSVCSHGGLHDFQGLTCELAPDSLNSKYDAIVPVPMSKPCWR
jgi:hypothetical protein